MSENRQTAIRPGEIWLVEQAARTDLAPLDRDAVTGANVILYDRELETLVADILPLGTYAEPLPEGEREAGSAISSRALRFAADGWRVVQIVKARPGWHEQLQRATTALGPPRRSGESLVFGPLAERAAVAGPAFTANGLAG